MPQPVTEEQPPVRQEQESPTRFPCVVALMPAWNAEEFIEPILTALLKQTYPNLKIIISDDQSSDRTPEICRRFADEDSRITFVQQETNLGWIGNVNALLDMAEGDYYFFAFHDDLLEPEYVRSLVDALERNPNAVIAFSDVELTHADGLVEQLSYPELEGIRNRITRGRRVIQKLGHWWIPNRGIFRAGAAKEIGGLKRHAAGEFVADWPWLTHMSLLGEFVRVPQCLCRKVYQKQSLSRTWKHSVLKWWAVSFSVAREVHHSNLSLLGKLRLYADLLLFCVRIINRRWKLKRLKALEKRV